MKLVKWFQDSAIFDFQDGTEREREFIFQVNQTKYYYELMNIAESYQNRQTPI